MMDIGIKVFQRFFGSNRSCVERRQGQKTGTVLPTANHVDALLLDEEVCDAHEYYYGIVVIVSEATAAGDVVDCHQRTQRASWPNEVDGNTPNVFRYGYSYMAQ
jgi:hypothetical protein